MPSQLEFWWEQGFGDARQMDAKHLDAASCIDKSPDNGSAGSRKIKEADI